MSKNLRLPLFCLLLTVFTHINAQNVGIGTSTPNSSAKLHIESTNSGLLIPRVSLVAVNNGTSPVNTPVTGVLVYNTNAAITGGDGTGFYFWNGTQWVPLKGGDNTLDMAYDEGGPGAGRIITADAGRVEINGTGGLLVNANTTTISEAALVNNTNGTQNTTTQLGYVGVNAGSTSVFGVRTIARGTAATGMWDGPMGVFGLVESPTSGGTINLNTTVGSSNKAVGVYGTLSTTTNINGSAQDMVAGVVGYTGLHNSSGGTVTGSRLYGGLFGGNGRVLGLWGENSAYMEFMPRWQTQNYETAALGFYNSDPNGGNNGANIGSGDSYFSIESNVTNSIQKNLVLQTRSVGNVGIGTNTPSEKLHVVGNTRISSLSGLGNRLVQSNATGVLSNIADGTAGQILTTNGAGVLSWTNASGNEWNITGNSGTVDGTNFIGTIDNVPFNIRVNNQRAGRIEEASGTANTFFGYRAGNINIGARNSALGYNALFTNSSAADNTAVGASALRLNNTGSSNTAVGSLAMENNSTGYNNTSLGYQSMHRNTTGYGNTSVGFNAGRAGVSGIYNTALGTQALESNISGSNNTAVGYSALFSNSASSNLAIGVSALTANTTGTPNLAIGHEALRTNVTGASNLAIGNSALYSNTASNNFAIGHNALDANTTGTPNLAIGADALGANITGANNLALGHNALLVSTASNNLAIGSRAMDANTSGNINVAIGADALGANTSGIQNIAIGLNALSTATTVSNNIAIGARALDVSTGGINVAIGTDALGSNTTATNNVGIGFNALFDNTTGENNVAVGRSAGENNTTGANNVAVGRSAGDNNTTGSSLTLLGNNADVTVDGLVNAAAIGAGATVAQSNSLILGNNANVGIGTSTPQFGSKLHVVGYALFSQTNAAFTSTSRAAYIRGNDNYSTATTPDYTWYNSDRTGMFHPADATIAFCVNSSLPAGQEMMRINGTGVGIGTTAPGGLLQLGLDQGRKPGTNTWTVVSDERLKNINGNYSKGLKELMQLQPIRYHYKNVGERTFRNEVLNTEFVGFSAQEVQKVFPEAVGTDADGYLNLNNHAILIAYLNAIKEQQGQIKKQEETIEAQKKELQDMNSRLERLEKMMEKK
jgi:hypothetical protein